MTSNVIGKKTLVFTPQVPQRQRNGGHLDRGDERRRLHLYLPERRPLPGHLYRGEQKGRLGQDGPFAASKYEKLISMWRLELSFIKTRIYLTYMRVILVAKIIMSGVGVDSTTD
jgi:hypothetical protein